MTKVIDVISQMRALDGESPKQEQNVANFVLSNLQTLAQMTKSEIAQASGVSVAAENRFCRTHYDAAPRTLMMAAPGSTRSISGLFLNVSSCQ